ncbi:MAG: GNAT family N-acetyltransferase [Thermoleophilia bacterium]|nr:GNAT family N-acetyltransferase [Thermoleophilia bacterium]
MTSFDVRVAESRDASALAAFAALRPLAWTDFASIAMLQPDEPRVWLACDDVGVVKAAAIDDGLAMSVGGSADALRAICEHVPDLEGKLVIAGRADEVRTFVDGIPGGPRRERPEHFMGVARGQLRHPIEAIPLRIATEADLPILLRVRAAALSEEYGIPVPEDSHLYGELSQAVTRAVGMQGVAIWVEDDHCAFTAQLIAKTADASMFGDLYVDPDLRGEGRATRALTAFCAWLMTESEHVVLRVGTDNEPAVRLYERVGFQVVDEFLTSLGSEVP